MNGDRLTAASRSAISTAQQHNDGVFVSPISAWEVGVLAARNRIKLTMEPRAWFEALLGWPAIRLAPMPPNILIASSFLPGTPPSDPADRIIASTARALGLSVITRDGELSVYAQAGHIDVIPC